MKNSIKKLIILITILFTINVYAEDGWITEDGNIYYYENNEKVSGFKEIDGKLYFFSSISFSSASYSSLLNLSNAFIKLFLFVDINNPFIPTFVGIKILFIVVVNFVINVLFVPVIFKLFSSTMVNHPFKLPVFGNFLYFLIPHRLHILQHILLVHLYQL